MRATKVFTFDAAHDLPGYDGKCSNLHGHTYRLEVTVERPVNKQTHMVIDFAILKDLVMPIIDQLDHRYLNEVVPYPTAEELLKWLWIELAGVVPGLYSLRLWETPTSYAEMVKEESLSGLM